ncbi:MAG: DUF167 domain-containing protein [Alphaproteobacteria bacterium]|nr:DUF167 domain-containing protein [Alphaproteobacteria bacterium]
MKQTPAGLQIQVKLTPKAAKNAILGWTQDVDGQPVLKAAVTAVPEKGKANDALIALLSKNWGMAKGDFTLLRGATDRNKILLLNGFSELPPRAGRP